MSMRQIRKALRARFGAGKYRITAESQVHYHDGNGWLFYGSLSETVADIERGTL
jgi:hypothetical protein